MKHTFSIRNGAEGAWAALTAFGLLVAASSLGLAQTNPAKVTTIGNPSGVSGWLPLAVSGNYLYAGNHDDYGAAGLHIFDVSNPTNSVEVGYIGTSGACYSVVLSGNRAFVATDSGLDVIDASSPTNPIVVGHAGSGPAWPGSIVTSSHFVYLASQSSSRIYDVSNPTNPVSLGLLPSASAIALMDNFAYLATVAPASPQGLVVCDVSDPANPSTVAFVETPAETPNQALVLGNYAYLTAYSKAGYSCWVFDISTRTNPVPVNRLVEANGAFYAMTVSGNYAYLVGDALSIYDISNPTNLSKVVSAELPADARVANVVLVSRNYAYIGGNGAISIYSLGNPTAPQLRISRIGSNNLLFAWPSPTAAFALQQATDLKTPNWVTRALNPVTVGSENRVVITKPPGNMFYRLVAE